MDDLVKRLQDTSNERSRATAEPHLMVVAKISKADGLLMGEAANRISALEAALKPFAEIIDRKDATFGKEWNSAGETMVPFADLRRAKAALEV